MGCLGSAIRNRLWYKFHAHFIFSSCLSARLVQKGSGWGVGESGEGGVDVLPIDSDAGTFS